MSNRNGLRAVEDSETLSTAARASHMEMLLALRNHIADEITAGVPHRELASLSRRLIDLGEAIAELEDEQSEPEPKLSVVSDAAPAPYRSS